MTTQEHNFETEAPASTGLTNDWDTVFAIRYTDVNNAIVRAGSSPKEEFNETITDEALRAIIADDRFGDSATIRGFFGDWAVAPGGSGHLVMMSLPVTTVTLTRPGHDDAVRTDVTYTVRVELKAVKRAGVNGPGGGDLYDFVLSDQGSGDLPAVTVEACIYDGWETDGFVHVFLVAAMQSWLNKNISKFSHVFATVNLNAKADHGRFDWLMPTETAYAVTDTGTLESGIFGVLCMTKNRAKPRNQQINPDALPEGQRASFLISRDRFLKEMLAPGLGTMFTGPTKPEADMHWPDDYFVLTDNDTALTNTHSLYIESLDVGKEGKPENVRAHLEAAGLNAKLEETYLNVHIRDLTHPYYKVLGDWWLKVHHTITTRNVARLTDDQVFDLIPLSETLGNYTMQHEAVALKTKWAKRITWAEIFVGLVALALPLARAGWLRCVAGEAEEIEQGAMALNMVEAEGPVINAEAENLAQEGAQGALGMIQNGVARLGSWIVGSFQSWRGRLIWAMSATLTTEQILAEIADEKAGDKLPKYDEFAASVMAPVQWPDAQDFEVTAVQFNGSFQTFGDPKFAE